MHATKYLEIVSINMISHSGTETRPGRFLAAAVSCTDVPRVDLHSFPCKASRHGLPKGAMGVLKSCSGTHLLPDQGSSQVQHSNACTAQHELDIGKV